MKKYVLLLLFAVAPAHALDHSEWDQLLAEHVEWVRDGQTSVVDYGGFNEDRKKLKSYLNYLSGVSRSAYDELNRDEKLAFLINAYNAFTVELVLRHYPAIDSIKEIGNHFTQPWDIDFVPLLGKERKLNELEHEMIRVWFDEPLIHFVVNCASVGCPALRPEALTGARLEEQMKDGARRFLRDKTRNRFDAGVMRVSPIFEWYPEDFENSGGVEGFLANYAEQLGDTPGERERIRDEAYELDYQRYNWNLNTREYALEPSRE